MLNPSKLQAAWHCVLATTLLMLIAALLQAGPASAAENQPMDTHSSGAEIHSAITVPALSINFEQAADKENSALSAWAERTRLDLEANYPLIYAQLVSPRAAHPESIELVFYRREDGSIAYAAGGRIHINCDYVEDHLDDIGMPIHELVHIIQAYSGGDCPGWLTEGIADWVRYFWYEKKTLADYAGHDPGNYDSGYGQSARFLEWLRLNRNPQIVPLLNSALREQSYGPDTIKSLCGADVETLWKDYLDSLAPGA
ncbi:hypothetical protein IT575_10570 [bacterium]|nr:hypothetical protein [bacterium]